jgi:hypothetical protein
MKSFLFPVLRLLALRLHLWAFSFVLPASPLSSSYGNNEGDLIIAIQGKFTPLLKSRPDKFMIDENGYENGIVV